MRGVDVDDPVSLRLGGDETVECTHQLSNCPRFSCLARSDFDHVPVSRYALVSAIGYCMVVRYGCFRRR